jgi:hypothetical protein
MNNFFLLPDFLAVDFFDSLRVLRVLCGEALTGMN